LNGLAASVRELLQQALNLYADDPRAVAVLHQQLGRFSQPLRIAVAGPWRSGKSTVVNAIIGESVAPVEAETGGAGPLFTWYSDGPEPGITAAGADDVVVTWPTRALRRMTLIDTPAVTSGAEDQRRSITDRILRDADALLYLTRDARGSDLGLLHSLQEGGVARAAPVNVVLVLARADETGGGRVDALLTARQLARRHHRDPEIGSLCMGVVALGGLLALAGRTLTEPDFAALAALAAAPRTELDDCLLSADRFVGPRFPAPVDPGVRRALLDRLGIFGVRLAATLIRTGSDSRTKLAAELVRRSGLTDLRESMGRYFTDRAEVLQARSALVTLESLLLRQSRRGSRELLARMEHTLAAAHDFRELRLLAALADPQLGFAAETAAEARRLVGGDGVDLTARLGVEPDAGPGDLWRLSAQALHRWQTQAEDPLLSLYQRRAAGVVVRSCEAMLAHLSALGPGPVRPRPTTDHRAGQRR
jgi:hypothetical protein